MEAELFLPVCFRGAGASGAGACGAGASGASAADAAAAGASHIQQRNYKHIPVSELAMSFSAGPGNGSSNGNATHARKFDASLLSLVQFKYANTYNELLAVLSRCVRCVMRDV